jgi:Fe-S-cluster containining protein
MLQCNVARVRPSGRWRDHPGRTELRALYAEADALVVACECRCSAPAVREDSLCCHFGLTGREPYPTPVELVEVDLALRARGSARPERGARGRLPVVAAERACPLLSNEGRCTIYESRPFGCRTYFCAGHEPPRKTREAIQSIGRRLSDLAARLFPRDPLPRPFTRALSGSLPPPPP